MDFCSSPQYLILQWSFQAGYLGSRSLLQDWEGVIEESNFTPLHRIILGLSPVKLLEQLKLDDSLIDATDPAGCTPLHWAVNRSDIEAMRVLLEWGADRDIPDRYGETPLHCAAQMGFLAGARLLLENGASMVVPNVRGCLPLHRTAFSGIASEGPAVVALLVENGTEVNTPDFFCRTALHQAAQLDHVSVGRALISQNADIEVRACYGHTPTMLAFNNPTAFFLRLLLKERPRLDEINADGGNILHRAAMYGNWHLLNALLDADLESIDPEASDNFGWTPVDYFCSRPIYLSHPVEGVSENDEWEVFGALLEKAGWSGVEEINDYISQNGDEDEGGETMDYSYQEDDSEENRS